MPTRVRRFSWPLALLVLSLAIMLGTAYQAHRLEQHRRRATAQLLHDYAAFAAWTFRQHLADALQEIAWQVVNPILHHDLHQSLGVPDAADLVHYRDMSLHQCSCNPPARPATYFAFALGSDTLGTAGAAPMQVDGAALNRRLTRYLRAGVRTAPPRMAILGPDSTVPALVAYGLMPTVRGDTLVYGFVYDPATVPQLFHSLFVTTYLLPPTVTRGQNNPEILALEVRNAAGEALWQTRPWPSGTSVGTDTLPARAGSLVIRATVRPEAAATLVAGAGSLSRAPRPVYLAVVLLALVLAAVALVQLRREEELARLRADFVASVSHELRTPLAQIRLFLDTLRLRRYRTDEQRDWLLGHLVRETTRLEHLVENVLQFSRLENLAGGPLVLEPADPALEIRETLTAFEPLAQSRQVTLQAHLAEGLRVALDRSRFRQLLLNLLDNAVKFGPPGQRVRVTLEPSGGTVQLAVIDQGPGVPPGEREAIWQPYRRGEAAAARAVGGSGIGLAIVRETARRLGGRTWVEDGPGGGARIVVELPLAEAAPAQAAS